MKRYNITVNGKVYDVAVEEATGTAPASAPAPVAAASAPIAEAPAPAPQAAPAPASSGAQGSFKVEAPMPGNIVAVKVNVGDTVTAGSVVVVLEAMKMENDIVAGKDGTIASVNVTKGAFIETGAVLVTIN